MAKSEALQVVTVDCCEHTLEAFESVPFSHLTPVTPKDSGRITSPSESVDLIVIGVARYPMRRLFISQMRRIYPNAPVLILRREELGAGVGEYVVRGEFILSDQRFNDDYDIVRSLRAILPLKPCEHTLQSKNYDTVREVVRIIGASYADPDLDLTRVAKNLPMSPAQLSRILNQQVGVSFRQLLRRTRIEEAKRMLASKRFSVKEVAARVGFTDSHYFSRSFKAHTGLSATEYKQQDVIFG